MKQQQNEKTTHTSVDFELAGDHARILKAGPMAALTIAPLGASAAEIVHLNWEGLPGLTGKTVRIAMTGGTLITGKVAGVEPDALLVNVRSTSDAKTYPKGGTRVPQATLHRFEMLKKRTARDSEYGSAHPCERRCGDNGRQTADATRHLFMDRRRCAFSRVLRRRDAPLHMGMDTGAADLFRDIAAMGGATFSLRQQAG